MADPTPEEIELQRRKKTLLLLVGGVLSLLIPLAGALYLKFGGSGEGKGLTRTDMFEKREAGDARITVTQGAAPPVTTPVMTSALDSPPPAAGGSSLSFVKGDGDFESKPGAAPAAPPPAPTAPAPPIAQGGPLAPEPAKGKAKGKKEFVMPKLQTGKGFTQMKGFSPKPTGGADISGISAPAAAGKGGDMAEMLKNLPPGTESNPELQKLLQSQGK